MGFDLNDIPYDKFLFGANAYLGVRQNKYKPETILYASDPPTLGLKASIRGLFYDFHSLMNDEIIFLHMPKYIQDKKFELSELISGHNCCNIRNTSGWEQKNPTDILEKVHGKKR